MKRGLRWAIVRSFGINTVLVFVLGIVLSIGSGKSVFAPVSLGWLLLLAILLGIFSAWRKAERIKSQFIESIRPMDSLVRIERIAELSGIPIDWSGLLAYEDQLKARGFVHLGDFQSSPLKKNAIERPAIRVFYGDLDQTTIVELQHSIAHGGAVPGVHYSMLSVLGGNISITSTDQLLSPTMFVLRSDTDVTACFPGKGLLEALSKHQRLVTMTAERIGKLLSRGLTLERYQMVQGRNSDLVKQRLSGRAAFEIAWEYDEFEQNPKHYWAPSKAMVASLHDYELSELDRSAYAKRPVPYADVGARNIPEVQGVQAVDADRANATSEIENTGRQTVLETDENIALRKNALARIVRSANWFYWIAGLSLLNTVVAILGSSWSFIIGLGFTSVLTAALQSPALDQMHSQVMTLLVWILCFLIVGLFALCGWLARRPSVVAFAVGIFAFAMDALIFVFAGDVLGMLLHAYVLFALGQGMVAAWSYRRIATTK